MSGFKDIVKNGWHPEKSGSSIRGSVSGLMGRNKDSPSSSETPSRVARPLSQLKDPATFAPPPKRTGSGLAPAPPPVSTKRQVVTSPSKYLDPRAEPAAEPPAHGEESRSSPRPCSGSTTGSSATRNLPKPPGRRDGADGRSPAPPCDEAIRNPPAATALPPSLPPRLPPRGNTFTTAASSPCANARSDSDRAAGQTWLNQNAVSGLGAAGVNVPALGIGREGSTNNHGIPSPSAPAQPSSGSASLGAQVNQLQARYAGMGTPSASSTDAKPPAEGTSWAQKRAALKTASDFHKDPSSLSLADAKLAASTANNFRQRHGDQVASGIKMANGLKQRYGVMDETGAYNNSSPKPKPKPQFQSSSSPPPSQGTVRPCTDHVNSDTTAAALEQTGKKRPPPPPKKKPGLSTAPLKHPLPSHGDEPPPVPLSTRPAF
ncbi:uncharacterized protein UV8b_06290 [Ustilaginoidea virens]|uniref:GMP synthase n=1 Tax=Ustilaginoidea virens TaxID=1159556 RepID=A0A1B5L420_USTVR|nr:uncharacterized protein UV8b_06290 [Ustilaginoidea virens]QUC22049.1 hypothetical protein UV8b_06290 [Ustilaginoidea virens]GAO18215.1 hypothetical protein UVI_02022820 [Ustilaginoidea virens]